LQQVTFNQIFPRSYDLRNDNSPDWHTEVGWDIDSIMNFIERELQSTVPDPDKFLDRAKNFRLDILALKTGPASISGRTDLLDFVQFELSTMVISWAIAHKRFDVLYAWLYLALHDDPTLPNPATFTCERLPIFLQNRGLKDVVIPTFLTWVKGLFYLDRACGGVKEIAVSYYSFASGLALSNIHHDHGLEAAAFIGDWAANALPEGEALPYLQALLRVFEQEKLSPASYARLGILLSTKAGLVLGLDRAHIAESLLERAQLQGHETLQLQVVSLAADVRKAANRLPELMAEIDKYLGSLPEDLLVKAYEKERIFELVLPVLVKFAEAGNTDAIEQILARWRGEAPVLPASRLFVFSTAPKGPLYAAHGEAEQGSSTVSLGQLTNSMNRFLGTNVVARSDDDFSPSLGREPGVPENTSTAASDAYLHHLLAALDLPALKRLFTRIDAAQVDAMVALPTVPHPLQALMVRELGFTFPWQLQAGKVQSDRTPVSSALIWHSSTTYGFVEAEWLTSLLQSAGVSVTREPEDAGIQDFKREYESEKYDVIWIIGHGTVDIYAHHQTRIDITESESLQLHELAQLQVPRDRRRLVVLSVCHSGTTAVLGGIEASSVAAILASRFQAVVAHLWLAENLPSAVFSVIVAAELKQGRSFLEAYRNTMKVLQSGVEGVESYLREAWANDDLLARIGRASTDWDRLFVWGSPAFFS
jgi:hypothetical protein